MLMFRFLCYFDGVPLFCFSFKFEEMAHKAEVLTYSFLTYCPYVALKQLIDT